MPYYVIAHADPLTVEQRDALAATITQIHTGLFTTPTIFVNVKFEGTSAVPHYVGGRKVGRPIQIPPPHLIMNRLYRSVFANPKHSPGLSSTALLTINRPIRILYMRMYESDRRGHDRRTMSFAENSEPHGKSSFPRARLYTLYLSMDH